MSEMQTLLAECLEMERGISKELTGKKHLERTDFIIAKQKQEAELAKAKKEKAVTAKAEAEAEHNSIEAENKAKTERSAALDCEIVDKQKKRDEIRKNTVDGILDSVMQSYGETEEQQAIGTWFCDYADSRQSFDKLKHRQTYKEVADVANGAYDWKIERG